MGQERLGAKVTPQEFQPGHFRCSLCTVPGFAVLISNLLSCCQTVEYLTQKTWSLKDSIWPIIPEHSPCAKPMGYHGLYLCSRHRKVPSSSLPLLLIPLGVRKEAARCCPEGHPELAWGLDSTFIKDTLAWSSSTFWLVYVRGAPMMKMPKGILTFQHLCVYMLRDRKFQ